MRSRSARLLLFSAAMAGLPACLLPPDDPVVETTYRPLAIDPESLVPTLPFQDVYQSCTFTAGATRVFDPDGRPLRARWVADNRVPGLVKVIVTQDGIMSTAPILLVERISTANDFIQSTMTSTAFHSLSLFVTDADDWAVPNGRDDMIIDGAILSGQVTDAGLIKTSSVVNGLPTSSVIELRWAFRFVPHRVCPPQ